MELKRKHKGAGNAGVPFGMNLLMWQALARVPWLLGAALDPQAEARHDAERRRRFDR